MNTTVILTHPAESVDELRRQIAEAEKKLLALYRETDPDVCAAHAAECEDLRIHIRALHAQLRLRDPWPTFDASRHAKTWVVRLLQSVAAIVVLLLTIMQCTGTLTQ